MKKLTGKIVKLVDGPIVRQGKITAVSCDSFTFLCDITGLSYVIPLSKIERIDGIVIWGKT